MKKILIIFTFLYTLSYGSEEIKLMTEIFPPFQYKNNGELIGISTEIVQEIQRRVGSKSKIKVYPWTRGVKILQKRKNSAIFSMLFTPERQKKYKWVGPLTTMKLIFFKKKGSSIDLKSLEDAKKVSKIGVSKKVANYEILHLKGFKNLDVITSGIDEKNIKKLVKGRIDLWPSLKSAGLYNAHKMGLSGEIVPIDDIVIFEGGIYIAFNKQTDDTIIKAWQNALDAMKHEHVIEKITKRYQ